jgi:4-carboxymuconolactone decarboxylase
MPDRPAAPGLNELKGFVPKFVELTEDVLFGDVWERPQLSKRDRSLITCAVLTALYRPEQLRGHIERARNNGLSAEEIAEMITHVAFYAGWPSSVTAARVASEVLNVR